MLIHLWQIETSTYQQEYLNNSTLRATGVNISDKNESSYTQFRHVKNQ